MHDVTGALAQYVAAGNPSTQGLAAARALLADAAPARRSPAAGAALLARDIGRIDDTQLAVAVAVGIEAARRIERSVTSESFDATWDAAVAIGVFAAAATAARALGLDAAATRHALGLAATQAAGPAILRGSAAEEFALAKAGRDGLEAALLARHGFTSAPASIEGRRGYAALAAERFDPGAILNG